LANRPISGTLALNRERQSARQPKTKKWSVSQPSVESLTYRLTISYLLRVEALKSYVPDIW